MHALKFASIIILLLGLSIFAIGLLIYWVIETTEEWYSFLILSGILFILGSIIMLCISFELEQPS